MSPTPWWPGPGLESVTLHDSATSCMLTPTQSSHSLRVHVWISSSVVPQSFVFSRKIIQFVTLLWTTSASIWHTQHDMRYETAWESEIQLSAMRTEQTRQTDTWHESKHSDTLKASDALVFQCCSFQWPNGYWQHKTTPSWFTFGTPKEDPKTEAGLFSVDTETDRHRERERQRDRRTDREKRERRETDRQTERRERETDRERNRQKLRQRDRDRQTDSERQTVWSKEGTCPFLWKKKSLLLNMSLPATTEGTHWTDIHSQTFTKLSFSSLFFFCTIFLSRLFCS